MIRLIKILLVLFIALALIAILSMHIMSCNTTKPVVVQYKDATFSAWGVENVNEVQFFTLLYSTDSSQKEWKEIKTIPTSGKNDYLDTTNFMNGYYRLRVNLKTGILINSGIEKIK